MKKVRKILTYIASNIIIVALMYYAVIEQVSGAANILYFIVGLVAAMSLLTLVPGALQKTASEMEEPFQLLVPAQITLSIDAVFSCFFIWHGWWWCGVVYFVASLNWRVAMENLRKLSQDNIINRLSS